ncbi:hypothetical protein C0J52_04820 [Blattella germanica]|nr:hypothetical protein C0J52_04820 [Blattella germanica]
MSLHLHHSLMKCDKMRNLLQACLFVLVLPGVQMETDFLNKSWNGNFCSVSTEPTSCKCDQECAEFGDCCHDLMTQSFQI